MRYKIENLEDINDARSFMKSYQSSCSYKLLKYSMYLIVLTLITILIWSMYAKKDIVVNTFGVIDVSNHVCNIYIENTSIGNISEGKPVQIEVISLARNDYGVITAKIKEVSDDVVLVENSGRKYYTASCHLEQEFLTDKSGDKVELKNGMEAKVSIICNRTTYFDFILGKLK